MSDVSTRAVLEIVGVDKTNSMLDFKAAQIARIKREMKGVESGGTSGMEAAFSARIGMFTGMVFLRAAQRIGQSINEYIDAPLKEAMEASAKAADYLYTKEAEQRVRNVSDALKDMKHELNGIAFTRSLVNEHEKKWLDIMELDEQVAGKRTAKEKDFLRLKQQQRAAAFENAQAIAGENELIEKQTRDRNALRKMIEARGGTGEVTFSIQDRLAEIKEAARAFQAAEKGANMQGFLPPALMEMMAKGLGFDVGKVNMKMLHDTKESLLKLIEAEKKNTETLIAEEKAMGRSIAQLKERKASLEENEKLLRREAELQDALYAKGEYEAMLERRKTYFEKLADAMRSANTESEAFTAGSSKWERYMANQGRAPFGSTAYMRGYQPGMTPAAPQTQQQFTVDTLKALRESTVILTNIYDYIKKNPAGVL